MVEDAPAEAVAPASVAPREGRAVDADVDADAEEAANVVPAPVGDARKREDARAKGRAKTSPVTTKDGRRESDTPDVTPEDAAPESATPKTTAPKAATPDDPTSKDSRPAEPSAATAPAASPEADADRVSSAKEKSRVLLTFERPAVIFGIVVAGVVALALPLTLCFFCGCCTFRSSDALGGYDGKGVESDRDTSSGALSRQPSSRRVSLDCSQALAETRSAGRLSRASMDLEGAPLRSMYSGTWSAPRSSSDGTQTSDGERSSDSGRSSESFSLFRGP